MDNSLLLQCEDCKKNLEDFLELSNATEDQKVLLTQFAVFMEMRRLKSNQRTQVLQTSSPLFTEDWTTKVTDNLRVTC